jgi:DNA-directed RNA polymerase specialized sigma24 family protein
LRTDQVERLIKLLALLLIKGEPQSDQLRTLVGAGFSNTEISRLLGLTPNAVNVALHRMRKRE